MEELSESPHHPEAATPSVARGRETVLGRNSRGGRRDPWNDNIMIVERKSQ